MKNPRISFSGKERNQLFLNTRDGDFKKVSGVSGANHQSDSRTFGILDYDRDGQLDFAVGSSNWPLLRMLRNQVGADPQHGQPGNMIAIRLVGGNRTAQASAELSNRDGIGAKVWLTTRLGTQIRERQAGEGLAAQNSSLLYFGVADCESIDKIEIRWPSGIRQSYQNIPANSLVTLYEDPTQDNLASGIAHEPYLRSLRSPQAAKSSYASTAVPTGPNSNSSLKLYFGFSPCCPACDDAITNLRQLRSDLQDSEIEFLGIPFDEATTSEAPQEFQQQHDLPFEVLPLTPETAATVAAAKKAVTSKMHFIAYPTSIVTDHAGRPLLVKWGVPTVSELRKLQSAKMSPAQKLTQENRTQPDRLFSVHIAAEDQ